MENIENRGKIKIVVFGSINMDLVSRLPRLPSPGETLLGSDFLTAPGGKGANQAAACARLGAAVVMFGRVSNDVYEIVALGKGHTLRAAVPFANISGAVSSTKRGAQPSMPGMKDIENYLKEQTTND